MADVVHATRDGAGNLHRAALAVLATLLTVLMFAAPLHAEPVRIAALGDSLTAGYGLPSARSLPARLEAALKAAGRDVVLVNHGVSGDTTAGGLARVDWMLGDKPALVLVALGANDALRGLDPAEAERNLDAIVAKLKAEKIAVILFGMKAPRNFGTAYVEAFDGLYERLASKHAVALYPFLLEGVAMERDLNQADGIHPNARGVEELVRRVLPVVTKALDGLARPG